MSPDAGLLVIVTWFTAATVNRLPSTLCPAWLLRAAWLRSMFLMGLCVRQVPVLVMESALMVMPSASTPSLATV